MKEEKNAFLKMVRSPLKFKSYLFFKLPIAFLSGIKIREITDEKCITSVPYKRLTQNPFHSTYFASLSMAAEMSTGSLAMMYTYKKNPAVSMLLIDMEGHYFKKAATTTFFICEDGIAIENSINAAVKTIESQVITVRSFGKNKHDELIAEFSFTWSFKVKLKKDF